MRTHKKTFVLTALLGILGSATAFAGPPTGNDQVTETINEDSSKSITLSVTDPDGDALTYSLFVAPQNGIATVTPNSEVINYVPNQDYNNTAANPETFVVKVKDTENNELTINIKVIVNPVNDPPTALPSTATTDEDKSVTITLTGNDVDGDQLTYSVTQQPNNGMLVGVAPNLQYVPNPNYFGTDSISYNVKDTSGATADATVTVTINPVNDAPEIQDSVINTNEDMATTVELKGTDPEGEDLTFTVTQQPKSGTLMGTSPQFSYLPNMNFVGADTIKFKASDGALESDEKTITINVGNSNDPPAFVAPTPDDMAAIDINEGDNFTLTVKGEDPDGDTLVYGIENKPDKASFDAATGVLTWTPDYTEKGEYTVTVSIKDSGEPLKRTFKLTVNIVDDDNDFLPLTLEQKLNLNPNSKDSDGDTIADNHEVGQDWANPKDTNNNSVIDALDLDSDSDTIPDSQEAGDNSVDTSPLDSDGDQIPDFQDTDSDQDEVEDANDNCRLKRNKDQLDTDGDGEGDKCDDDIDNDGIANAQDSCPTEAAMTETGCVKRVVPTTKEDEGCASTGLTQRGTVPGALLMLIVATLVGLRRKR